MSIVVPPRESGEDEPPKSTELSVGSSIGASQIFVRPRGARGFSRAEIAKLQRRYHRYRAGIWLALRGRTSA